jgi:hypothetical protein
MNITATDKQKEAEREVAMRRNVYPKWIAAGRMKQDEADRRVAVMEQIAADYREQAERERLL